MPSFRRRRAGSRTKLAASQRGCSPINGRAGRRARSFELLEPRLFLANQPLITEFAASNGALLDGDGLSPDWIEIHNPTSQAINLAGWHLTDEADNLDKWTFPAAQQSILDPGEYLIVFASGQNVETYIDPAGYLHIDFGLSSDGEYLALTDASQNIIHEYAPNYPRQVFDISYGLLPNTSPVTLVGDSHPTSAFVPTNSSLDASSVNVPPAWTLPSFNDASWSSTIAGTGVGFDSGDDAPPGSANGTVLPTGLIGFDLTDADQNGVLDGSIFEGGPANWPAAEQPPKALDNTSSTKWLAFLAEGAPYGFQFAGGQRHAVNAYTITSANDSPNRDPYAWTLSGSDDGVTYDLIDTRSAQTFTDRFQTRLYEFTNSTAYEYYRFDFKTKFGVTGLETDRPSANAIQMAEIELFARGPVDFNPHINLNVQSAYTPHKTSVYQRVEFEVSDPAALLSLSLEMQYDDGIIVYLNGKRVAAANAPSATILPTFQTNATGQRGNAAALVPQMFDLSPHLGELVAGTNVLAIHVLNVNDTSADLFSKPRLVGRQLNDESLVPVYMADTTPGALNVTGYVGLVDPPQFSVEHGFYNSPFQLAITTPTPNAQIYYTTDGSAPSPTNGTLYTGPITVDRTRTIRADAFREGWLSADSVTNTYIFINEIVRQNYQAVINAGFPATWGGVAADYGLDPDVIGNFNAAGNPTGGDLYNGIYAATIKNDLLAIPTMSIVVDMDDMFGPNGIYTNSTLEGVGSERAVSLELINPDGSTGFHVEAGIEIHGGAFKRHDLSRKHSFRLKFKGIYEGNTELEFPLFGNDAATSFDTIVLRMDSNDGYAWNAAGASAQYARDEWGRRSQAALGQHAIHGTRVHLYINGVYWGIYNPVERADASFSASYYGGEKHEWDATNSGDPVDGTMAAWNTLVSLSQAVSSAGTEAAKTAAYMKVLGLNPDGTDNASFETYLDAVNYVDYLMVNFYGANVDWPHRNWYTSRHRGPDSQGFVFHNWDYETALDLAGSSLNTNSTGASSGAAVPYSSLKASQEFRVLFGDRVHRAFFNNGPLTSANSIARYQEVVAELQQIIVAESARWGDMHRSTPYTKADWQGQIPVVINFLTQRNNIFLGQLRTASLYPNVDAPTFSQHGGQVATGYNLSITAPAGAIWYTVDASDPRAIGGGVSPSARQYTGTPLNITGGITVRARVLSGGQWSALNEADFATDVSSLRITELNYNPAPYPGVIDRQDIEFFEVMNTGSQSVSLNGVQIGGFADDPYTFANGLTLAAGQRIIVARDPAVFQFVYGAGFNVAPDGFDPANLSNGGELVTLLGPLGEVLQSFTYGSTSPWPSEPDGLGPSLEIINPLGDSANAANWRASAYVGGSPGASGIVGDYDDNTVVNVADYSDWQASFGRSLARGTGADGNRDGNVNAADFVVWRKALAAAPAGGASTIASAAVVAPGRSSAAVSSSTVGGVSDADIESGSQLTSAAAIALPPTSPTSGRPTFSVQGRPALPLRTDSDPFRDVALLSVLNLSRSMATESEPTVAFAPHERDDDPIQWIDEAFASSTLL